jgi:hypothetical protein
MSANAHFEDAVAYVSKSAIGALIKKQTEELQRQCALNEINCRARTGRGGPNEGQVQARIWAIDVRHLD